MKFNSMKKIGGAILGLLLFAGISVMSSTTAQAQYPYDRNYYRRQERERRQREQELQRQQAQQARQSGWYDQNGNWHSNGSYNNGSYNNGYYNNGSYRGRSSDGYPYYPGTESFRTTALNAGYGEGVKAGRDDRRHGRYNPTRYGNTLKDYNSRIGDRAMYQEYYMRGFEHGYADGYSGH